MSVVLFALAALVCWGVGDFLIQRCTRRAGLTLTIFCTAAVGAIALSPWALQGASQVPLGLWCMLGLLGLLLSAAAFTEFEAMRIGKLGVVEMLFCIEIPVTVALAVWLHGDQVGLFQGIFMACMLAGLVLLCVTKLSVRSILERGAFLALLGASIMGVVNFMTADAAQRSSATLAIWFPCVVLTVVSGAILLRGTVRSSVRSFKRSWKLLLAMSSIDTAAWLFYALATSAGETAVTTAVTQGYPALALALGVRFNRERFAWHQWLGAGLCFLAALALAVTL